MAYLGFGRADRTADEHQVRHRAAIAWRFATAASTTTPLGLVWRLRTAALHLRVDPRLRPPDEHAAARRHIIDLVTNSTTDAVTSDDVTIEGNLWEFGTATTEAVTSSGCPTAPTCVIREQRFPPPTRPRATTPASRASASSRTGPDVTSLLLGRRRDLRQHLRLGPAQPRSSTPDRTRHQRLQQRVRSRRPRPPGPPASGTAIHAEPGDPSNACNPRQRLDLQQHVLRADPSDHDRSARRS